MPSDDVPSPRVALALLTTLLMLSPLPVASGSIDAPSHMAPPLQGPNHTQPQRLGRAAPRAWTTQGDGLRAVAIVGDVGQNTATYRDDMDGAVRVLQRQGVAVRRFYAGQHSFTWGDIVTAASGAHVMLYMGHGIYWGEPCQSPPLVGGFYLYDNQFVSPDQIRTDLDGRMAEDGVVILSHVCYSAGMASCDGGGAPSQAEAERRVRMYAAPFVDIGAEAYFANNYYDSAATIVEELLADAEERQNVGDIFKSVYPYAPSEFRDLSYPDAPGYDLWLSGRAGDWEDAFVGVPAYVFDGDMASAELGPLPASLAFTYNAATQQITPEDHILTPVNTGKDAALTWSAAREGDWFGVSATSGTSPPDRIAVEPLRSAVAGLSVGHYDGRLTVTVTDPSDTENGVQEVDLALQVVAPRLGNLPSELDFTYLLPEGVQVPSRHRLTPRNIGSNDELSWQVSHAGDWFSVYPATGTSGQPVTVLPDDMAIGAPLTYRGVVTVAVTAPAGTLDAVQTIPVTFRARWGEPTYVWLPAILQGW